MRRFAFAALLLSLSLSACSGFGFEGLDFGDPYSLAPGGAPTLDGATVTLPVAYDGGCEEHEFRLRSNVTSNNAEVWFQHDANGDDCERRVEATATADLPSNVQEATSITLALPNGIRLRLR